VILDSHYLYPIESFAACLVNMLAHFRPQPSKCVVYPRHTASTQYVMQNN
jgi:hypothetical protein